MMAHPMILKCDIRKDLEKSHDSVGPLRPYVLLELTYGFGNMHEKSFSVLQMRRERERGGGEREKDLTLIPSGSWVHNITLILFLSLPRILLK